MYSPPPMDGFSPPPMSDFSPPPLSDLSPLRDFPPPINGFSTGGEETEDDEDFNFGLGDNQYDLTGLSDKINRLELEKMKSLPPREILELKRESSGLFPVHAASDPGVEESDSNLHSNDGESLTQQQTKNSYETEPSQEQQDTVENICPEDGPEDDEYKANTAGDDEDCDNDDHERVVLETDPVEEPVPEENVESEDEKSLERLAVELPSEEEEPSKGENESVKIKTEAEIDFVKDAPAEVEEEDASWGEFPEDNAGDAGESWSNFQSVPNDEWSLPAGVKVDDRADLEFDESEEDDDDFGDFGEASDQIQSCDAIVESSLLLELKQLRENSKSMLESVYSLSSGEPSIEEDEVKISLEESVLKEGELFEKISNPASAPALDHEWRESCTYNTLLLTLGIDSSSNLDGEEWRSSAGRLAPRSAASLMTPGLLTPQAVSEKQEAPEHKSTTEGDAITPAQFDWNKSGLTNPLSDNGRNLSLLDIEFFTATSYDTSLLKSYNNSSHNGEKSSPVTPVDKSFAVSPVTPVDKRLAPQEDNNNDSGGQLYKDHVRREAQNILDGLPLLNFMSSNVLMFPTKSISSVKNNSRSN